MNQYYQLPRYSEFRWHLEPRKYWIRAKMTSSTSISFFYLDFQHSGTNSPSSAPSRCVGTTWWWMIQTRLFCFYPLILTSLYPLLKKPLCYSRKTSHWACSVNSHIFERNKMMVGPFLSSNCPCFLDLSKGSLSQCPLQPTLVV